MMRLFTVISFFIGMTGCGPLIDLGNTDADRIYTIQYSGQSPALSMTAASIFVDEFQVGAGLDREAVLVKAPDGEQMQISGISWADQPADMLRDYMVAVIRSKAGMRAYGEGALDIHVGCRLSMRLMDYQLNSSDLDQGTVKIALELLLVQLQTGNVIAEYRVDESLKLASNGNDAVIAAFKKGTDSAALKAAIALRPYAGQCVR